MLRIISGKYWNRKLFLPRRATTRPMTDKMRESLFNILGDVEGLYAADLYAGTGSIGLEALSRGVVHVDGVEQNRGIIKVLKKNIEKLGVNREYTVYPKDVRKWLEKSDKTYNLIFADPPYAEIDDGVLALTVDHLLPGGLLALHHEKRYKAPDLAGLEHLKSRRYGAGVLSFYRKPA